MKTNEEIKKGLELCFNGLSCEPCPYNDGETPSAVCDDHLGRDALELIKQQEQKIEELTAENERLEAENKRRKNKIVLEFEIDKERLEKAARQVYQTLNEAADRAIKDATVREA